MIAKVLTFFKLGFVVSILASESAKIEVGSDRKSLVITAIEKACKVGNLSELRAELQEARQFDIDQESLAASLHTLSNLALIMDAEASKAVDLHLQAKQVHSSVIPPLAQMHINGLSCGGLGDLYYVTAVSIKRLVDERNNSAQYSAAMFTAHTTLLTLLFDSGLNAMAETHLSKAFKINPSDSSLKMRSALMTPAIFKTIEDLRMTRRLLETRIDSLLADTNFTLATLDEFVLSPTFYFAYQGFNDREILSKLRAVYVAAYRNMSVALIDQQHSRVNMSNLLNAKIKIGFVSSYFRRHSVCKLFCGVIAGLDRDKFDVFLFSSMAENDADAFTTMVSNGATFLRVGKTLVGNRHIVTSRNIDVLVYLDIGMEPSTVVWAAARLASVQVALWGHPSTSGTDTIDYFLSSDSFHASAASIELPQAYFVEQLVRLDSLGFYFDRPVLKGWKKEIERRGIPEIYYEESLVNRPEALFDYLISSLTNPRLKELAMIKKTSQVTLILCPQHLPKFHPDFDEAIKSLLSTIPSSILVLLGPSKKQPWKLTLLERWMGVFGENITNNRIVWLGSLSAEEYLSLLILGDVMLDPYPFGGGVTMLESLAVATPIITLPARQTVPALADGMLRKMALEEPELRSLAVSSLSNLVDISTQLLANPIKFRALISRSIHLVFNDQTVFHSWEKFFAISLKQLFQ